MHNLRVVWEQSATITYKYHFVEEVHVLLKYIIGALQCPYLAPRCIPGYAVIRHFRRYSHHLTSAGLYSHWQKVAPNSSASGCCSFHGLCEVLRWFISVFQPDAYKSEVVNTLLCDFTNLDLYAIYHTTWQIWAYKVVIAKLTSFLFRLSHLNCTFTAKGWDLFPVSRIALPCCFISVLHGSAIFLSL